MKRRTILLAITLALIVISWVLFSPNTKVKNFSVPGQRVDSGKSAALYEKWDGKGDFVDMIWR